MANYFVDSTTGDNGDDGTTMDLAWATLEYALESGGLSAGDIVWVRRVHSEEPGGDIDCAYKGTTASFIKVIGWPRAADSSITEADWTNGSTTVDNIVGLSMDREKHLGRFITGPDGYDYLITKITDSDTIVIDREYAGSTVTSTDGACTIKADEDWADDMGTAYSFDDSGWTIQESDWDSDADDLPNIDLSTNNKKIYPYSDYNHYFANIDFTAGTAYVFFCIEMKLLIVRGCIFSSSADYTILYNQSSILALDRCILVGADGAGNSQRAIALVSGVLFLNDVAIYSIDYACFYLSNHFSIRGRNVNINVESAAPTLYNFFMSAAGGESFLSDTKIGSATNANIYTGNSCFDYHIGIEDFGKVLGANKRYTGAGTLTKTDVVAGSGDPYKRSGGADSVLEILYNIAAGNGPFAQNEFLRFAYPIFTHEFEATTDSKSYRYYVQGEGAVTAAQLWIECEYVAEYDDTSEYIIKKVTSDEAVSARSGASDWSQYIEVTDIQPAVASKVRIKCYCSYYHATNKIYIDPKVVISDG